MAIVTDPEKIEEVMARGVEKVYPDSKTLKSRMLSGKKIRLYCGYDPSSSVLHIGHMITLRKLAQFQKLGHEVIMLVGDFTGMIGDPTDKTAARKKLTRKEVLANALNYKKQAGKFLKFEGANPVKILYNSSWSDKLSFLDLIEIASNFTVQQMIVRDMFQERLKDKKPIFLHEFLYPLAQGYDSVAMDVDLEVGGKDQTFNMLIGRDLMKAMKKKEKCVMALKLLADPSGKKMGKSEGNAVNLDASPGEMYGKIMAWPDDFISVGLELCTDLSMKEVRDISLSLQEKKMNPREAKAMLAREIVTLCHSKSAAQTAEDEFNRVFRQKEVPSEVPQIHLPETSLDILELLVKTKMASSKSEAKRLILQKGVKIDGAVQDDWRAEIKVKKGLLLQIGSRRFCKIS